MGSDNHFYVTTAIDYPNGAPHLGHVYEKIVADLYARWYRFLGYDVLFLTGTDENGQKLAKAAADAGAADTKTFIDEKVDLFKALCRDIRLTNNDFIRTTEPRHIKQTHAVWKVLEERGDIYFSRYAGLYCLSCETFYPESQAENGLCPEHGVRLEYMEEDGFFFRMGQYQDWIIEHIASHGDFIFPESARREILSRLRGEELRDLSISRPNTGWGIPTPSRPDHVIYTWFDALINYYSALETPEMKERYWPANMHVIGKDITWFHTVIWPIILHAAGLECPKQVHVHGMLLAADGRKMSKSLGNAVDPQELIQNYSNDLLRYYLLRAIPSGQDGAFSVSDMIKRNNYELANDYGNLALRVIKLSAKRIGQTIDASGTTPDFDFRDTGAQMKAFMEQREHHRALDVLWEAINRANAYLNEHEPWRIKDDPARFKQHMYNGLYAVYCFATLIEPFLPETATKTFKMLGLPSRGLAGLTFGEHRFQLGDTEPLFPKIEPIES